jgi:hypothetical protein
VSISLATKGIIAQYVVGGGGGSSYPTYVPMDTPNLSTEEVGEIDIHPMSLKATVRSVDLAPSMGTKELKPKIKAE